MNAVFPAEQVSVAAGRIVITAPAAQANGVVIMAHDQDDPRDQWPVQVGKLAPGIYLVSGRMTQMDLYLKRVSDNQLMVALPSFQRAGYIPCFGGATTARDIRRRVGLDNVVDSATLAAAINWALKEGGLE